MELLTPITSIDQLSIGTKVKYQKYFYILLEEVYGEVLEVKQADLLGSDLQPVYKVKIRVTERYNPQGGRKKLPIKKATCWYTLSSLNLV